MMKAMSTGSVTMRTSLKISFSRVMCDCEPLLRFSHSTISGKDKLQLKEIHYKIKDKMAIVARFV